MQKDSWIYLTKPSTVWGEIILAGSQNTHLVLAVRSKAGGWILEPITQVIAAQPGFQLSKAWKHTPFLVFVLTEYITLSAILTISSTDFGTLR